jgi:hypothetical protein
MCSGLCGEWEGGLLIVGEREGCRFIGVLSVLCIVDFSLEGFLFTVVGVANFASLQGRSIALLAENWNLPFWIFYLFMARPGLELFLFDGCHRSCLGTCRRMIESPMDLFSITHRLRSSSRLLIFRHTSSRMKRFGSLQSTRG